MAVVILIITLISNSANLTDGIDGLATGVSAIIGSTLAVLAYVSGNIFFANYLNIMYLPDSGELVIFIAAFVGACIGFFMVQHFSGSGFYGRYRFVSLRRNNSSICNYAAQRAFNTTALRHFLS